MKDFCQINSRKEPTLGMFVCHWKSAELLLSAKILRLFVLHFEFFPTSVSRALSNQNASNGKWWSKRNRWQAVLDVWSKTSWRGLHPFHLLICWKLGSIRIQSWMRNLTPTGVFSIGALEQQSFFGDALPGCVRRINPMSKMPSNWSLLWCRRTQSNWIVASKSWCQLSEIPRVPMWMDRNAIWTPCFSCGCEKSGTRLRTKDRRGFWCGSHVPWSPKP